MGQANANFRWDRRPPSGWSSETIYDTLRSGSGLELSYFYLHRQLGNHFEFRYSCDRGKMQVTARNLDSIGHNDGYHPDIRDELSKLSPGDRLIGVAEGLAELVPYACSIGLKPVVIDPFDYALGLRMLKHIRGTHKFNGDSDTRQVDLNKLIYRAEIILDPDKVTLINKPIEVALTENQELKGSARLVVDNFGVSFWKSREHDDKAMLE